MTIYMQRLSNVALGIALFIFISAMSISLLAAAWLMITHVLSPPARWIAPAWLFIVLFTLSNTGPVRAQSVTSGAFAVVEERNNQPNGQVRVSYSIATTFDSVPPPVRRMAHSYKQPIRTTPAWPDTQPQQWDQPGESAMPRAFYIIATSPITQPQKPNYGWINTRP